MNDDELIAAVAGGDDTALRELFSRHAPWLATRLRQALAAADVEDVLQETFLAVWRGAHGYRTEGQGGAWIWGIARRQAALFLRRRGPATLAWPAGQDAADAVAAATGRRSADPADAALARAELDVAVATLGPDDSPEREAWRLIYVEDRPVAEAAELMGVPAGTAKSRAHRARHRLRAALRSGGQAPHSGDPAGDGGTR